MAEVEGTESLGRARERSRQQLTPGRLARTIQADVVTGTDAATLKTAWNDWRALRDREVIVYPPIQLGTYELLVLYTEG